MGFIAPLKTSLSTKVTKEHEEKTFDKDASPMRPYRVLRGSFHPNIGERTFMEIPLNSLGMECLRQLGLVRRLFCKYLAHQVTNLYNLGVGDSIDHFAFLSLRSHDAA